jgi:hypothetical protein
MHPDELPLAAGYQAAYAIPLDRWLMPLFRRLPKTTQTKIAAAADLTPWCRCSIRRPAYKDCRTGRPSTVRATLPAISSLYRRSDGVLITGDAVVTVDLNSLMGILTSRQGVFGPPRYSTWDWAAAQRSIVALAALEPRVLARGHGLVRVDGTAQALHALAGGQDLPARWR